MSLNVLHVIRGLANSSGTTHIVIPLAEAQARLGCKVRVLHVEKPRAPSLQPDPALVASECYPLTLRHDNPGLSLPFARALPAHVAAADVVHVHAVWNFPSWWAMRTAARLRKPYMVAPQGSLDPWALRQNRRLKAAYAAAIELPLMRRASCMQALTAKEAGQFRAAGIQVPSVVLPNGIAGLPDTTPVPRLVDRYGFGSERRALLFLSRVHPKKGLDLLLQAFARLRQQRDDVVLVVAGGDAGSGYLEQMRRLAAELGVAAQCCFVGEVAGSAKFELLRGADGYALVSRSEGLPVAAVEALGCGLPCILSDQCNLPEVEQADAGWTVPCTVEAAERALAEWLDQPQRAAERGQRARALVQARFTWPRIAEQSLVAYRAMLDGTTAALEQRA